jgi:TfdA family taurine catabolism dioxygenase TauD
MYLGEVSDATAWHREDLADRRWLVEIPAAAVSELEAMAAAAMAAGIREHTLRTCADAADPVLFGQHGPGRAPALDALTAKLRTLLEAGPGFALARRLPVEAYTRDEAALVYWALARRLGRCVTQNARGETLCEVRDYRLGGLAGTTVRGYQTNEALPFHTDSPDVVVLLCLQRSHTGGDSAIASSMSIYNEIVRHHREYLATYYAGVFYDWRGEGPPGQPPVYRNPIYGYFGGQLSCRYYLRQFAESAGRHGFALAAVEREALTLFEELAARTENHVAMAFEPGDVQLVDNNVVLHARSSYADSPGATPRCLLRIWVNFGNGRVFPPYFARNREGFVARRAK